MLEYTPPKGFDTEAKFFKDLESDINNRKTTFVGGFDNEGKLHGGDSYRTLIQLGMNVLAYDTYAKTGLKLTRHWRPTNVKEYYGVKGNPKKVAALLKELQESIIQTLAA